MNIQIFNIAVETTSFPTLLENARKSAKTKFHLRTSHLFFLLNAWLAIDVVILRPQRRSRKKRKLELMPSSKYSHLMVLPSAQHPARLVSP
jgi:hypothetical protein